jgi:REP element-mobilizing transposase RayT
MQMTPYGVLVQACWHDLPHHYPHVRLDAFTVMPNHVHGIIILTGNTVEAGSQPVVGAGLKPVVGAGLKPVVGAGLKPAPTGPAPTGKRHGLPEIVRAFKTFSSRRINELRGTPGTPIWQRNYYEHIIRSEDELKRVREYIANNALQWALDRENPHRVI